LKQKKFTKNIEDIEIVAQNDLNNEIKPIHFN